MEEFSKQTTELKKNTNNIDLHKRQSKQREEDLHVTREGITYKAGDFDETKLCREGKKRKNL